MSIEIKVPVLGESVVEATVSRWLKGKGEAAVSYTHLTLPTKA